MKRNRIQIQGIIGSREELNFNSGNAVRLQVAVDHSYNTRAGEKVTDTTWFEVTVQENEHNPALGDLTVGKMVNITGRQRMRRFIRKDGSDGYAWEIIPKIVSLDIPDDKKRIQYAIVYLNGRVGRVEVIQAGDKAKANLSVATEHAWKDKDGNWVAETTWHNVVLWGNKGVKDLSLLHKGMPVKIDGRVRDRKYTAADGSERYMREIDGISWDEVVTEAETA